ncbi:MAG: uL22 family ribosomal protein [Candidatus Shapirobacteria bacterium]|nr:uL22 family ribosomal protein [Candidatus Shapirobacteria bacterium]
MAQIIKKNTISTKTPKIKIAKKAVEIKAVKVKKPVETKTETVFKIAKYVNKNLMVSPRKLRLLVNRIRPLSPNIALTNLKFVNTKAARILIKALTNIIADAKNNFNLDIDSLKFDTIKADEAMKIKRMDKSHGSHFARGIIQKRHSRLLIKVKGVQK